MRRYADPGYFRFAKPLELAAIVADRLLDSLGRGWGRLYFTVTIKKPETCIHFALCCLIRGHEQSVREHEQA